VLAVYRLAHDPRFPVICMDESSKQLIVTVLPPVHHPATVRSSITNTMRHGVATLFVEVEPLTGRHVEVTERRTRRGALHQSHARRAYP
jgi:hypothetical protein